MIITNCSRGCVAIVRVNLGSVAFCDVEGPRFRRMFITYTANVNEFKLGCRMILFMDGTHLSGPYKGTLIAACTLDADSHLFNFAYGIVCGEKIEEWVGNDCRVLGGSEASDHIG